MGYLTTADRMLIGGELVHHLLRLPYRHFETTASGVISERMRQLDSIRAFFTGQMRIVDTAGRVERFEKRFGRRNKGE